MAKAFLACFRKRPPIDFARFLESMFQRLKPDNAHVQDHHLYERHGLLACVFNPPPFLNCHEGSFCLGVAMRDAKDILAPQGPRPDGTFALFRSNEKHVEILTDYTATRTIWYYCTSELFIASTSQRLIVSFMGSFVPCRTAASWMLLTGTSGPKLSWDRRMKYLPSNSTLLLDRTEWTLSLKGGASFGFAPATRTTALEHRRSLENAVVESIERLDLGNSKWALALSGGMDSRSLLYYLKSHKNLLTLTWGLKDNMGKPGNDATIAKQLSQICGLPHQYYETDIMVDVGTVFERFLIAGEGRIDHLSGYMDGLSVWSRLSRTACGIIRGYDPFGAEDRPVSPVEVRQFNNLYLPDDFRRMNLPGEYQIADRDIPGFLYQRRGESLSQYRGRLWLSFRTPFVTAALDEIKAAYVEVVNPLLCRRIVATVQSIPDSLREKDCLWKGIISDMFPGVPFASTDAIQALPEILQSEPIKALLGSLLQERKGPPLFSSQFLRDLRVALTGYDKRTGDLDNLKRSLRSYLPAPCYGLLSRAYRRLQDNRLSMVNPHRLALRTAIVIRVNEMLTEDASVVSHGSVGT